MSKYNSKKVVVNGIEFASQKEGNRYKELLLLERAGKISHLQTQVKYELIPAQYVDTIVYSQKTNKPKTVKKLVERRTMYIADFVYQKDGETIVEDVKGYRQNGAYTVFVIKRKLMLYKFGIRVKEV